MIGACVCTVTSENEDLYQAELCDLCHHCYPSREKSGGKYPQVQNPNDAFCDTLMKNWRTAADAHGLTILDGRRMDYPA